MSTFVANPWDILPDMGRRRGQRKGHLFSKSGSWILQWREDGRDIAGRPTRDKRSMAIAKSEGPEKVSKRQAQRIAWDTVLSRLDTVSNTPGSMVQFGDFVRERFEPDHMWGLKPAGQEHYRYMLSNHVLPYFGTYRLRDTTSRCLLLHTQEVRGSSPCAPTNHSSKSQAVTLRGPGSRFAATRETTVGFGRICPPAAQLKPSQCEDTEGGAR